MCVCAYVYPVLVRLFTKYFWISFLYTQGRTAFPCPFEVRWHHVTCLASEMWAEVVCFMSRWKFWEPVFISPYSLPVAVAAVEAYNDTRSLSVWLPEWSGSRDSQQPVLDMQCQEEIHFCLTKPLRYKYCLLPQHNLVQRLAYFFGKRPDSKYSTFYFSKQAFKTILRSRLHKNKLQNRFGPSFPMPLPSLC